MDNLKKEHEHIVELYIETRRKYLECLRNLRFSQKKNERYKRVIKKLRGTLSQDIGTERISIENMEKRNLP